MKDLLKNALNGDDAATEKIFRHLLVRFRLFAAQKIGDNDIADEIAQKACITVLERFREQEFEVGFEAWAYGVFRMTLKAHFSRRDTRLTSLNNITVPQASHQDSNPDLNRRLRSCLKKIFKVNIAYARALNFATQGYGTEEICDRLNLKRSHLYVILFRGRALLRRCLDTGEVN